MKRRIIQTVGLLGLALLGITNIWPITAQPTVSKDGFVPPPSSITERKLQQQLLQQTRRSLNKVDEFFERTEHLEGVLEQMRMSLLQQQEAVAAMQTRTGTFLGVIPGELLNKTRLLEDKVQQFEGQHLQMEQKQNLTDLKNDREIAKLNQELNNLRSDMSKNWDAAHRAVNETAEQLSSISGKLLEVNVIYSNALADAMMLKQLGTIDVVIDYKTPAIAFIKVCNLFVTNDLNETISIRQISEFIVV